MLGHSALTFHKSFYPDITGEERTSIEGVVPNPTERISGCSFWPRCPHATEQCKQGEPPVVQLSEERQVRCWLYADAAEKKEG